MLDFVFANIGNLIQKRMDKFEKFASVPSFRLLRNGIAPYLLRAEVPLCGENTGLIRSSAVFGKAEGKLYTLFLPLSLQV